MIATVRSELLKFFTTRLWWGMAIAVVLVGAAFAALNGFFLTSSSAEEMMGGPMDPTDLAINVYTGGLGVGYVLLLTIGVMQVGSEYRHKTITSTFLATPRRVKVMGSKVLALLVLGVVYGLLAIVSSVFVGGAILGIQGAELFPSADVWRTLALGMLVLGLWALIGLGVGILIPNQVAALVLAISIAWIVEPIIGVLLGITEWGAEIAQYLPSAATSAVLAISAQPGAEETQQLSWWAGALVLAGWAALFAVPGIFRAVRQDVS
ncbi:ABC transporter permease [Janibacter alkaliphilus]|uniref:ABC-2 family transporter protein n=1 Tax=Janibacter alkaliphilus TaxID=1069963 RepID=A0A852XAL3_9MICO|nr:ABC transporter permease [Janibacter alkaliphilus]NYG37404.1 hypothetical protein [Janibacter alkaliphilus]